MNIDTFESRRDAFHSWILKKISLLLSKTEHQLKYKIEHVYGTNKEKRKLVFMLFCRHAKQLND